MKRRAFRLLLACTALWGALTACEPPEQPLPQAPRLSDPYFPLDTLLPPGPLVPDTVEPGSYYPVYPGSFWEYDINGQPGRRDSTSATYLPHRYQTGYDSLGQPTYSDTAYVPFLNGEPIYGYSKIEHPLPPFMYLPDAFWPILSETVGFSYTEGWTDPRFGDHNEYLQVVSKTLEGGDSVITVRGHRVYGLTQVVSTRKYVKGIGLTLWMNVDTVANDTYFRQELRNYFINH